MSPTNNIRPTSSPRGRPAVAATMAHASSPSTPRGPSRANVPAANAKTPGSSGITARYPALRNSGVEETCSCTKAVVDGNPFAGLTCEYGATKSCMTLGSDSKHSFCTNGGECQDIVGDNELHKDCICPDGFEGPHCEYISGTKPSFLTSNSNGANYSSESPLSNSILYALMAGVCILIDSSFVILCARRAEAVKKERELQRATEELAMVQLDLDDDDDHGYGARPAFI
ncbi:hypothetical protein HJC23_010023 [Cyclotella cryptica]|uniref:EGF-like domain-containing protein n=1 Tax=Cyclotella cryptica TaxID=29204 RepID=A0ABD3PSP6_9STRA